MLTLASGTGLSQAIPIAASFILTRIYTPEDFGVLGVYIALVAIFSAIASLKYDAAILLPKQNNEAAQIIRLSVRIAIAMAISLTVILLLAESPILKLLETPELSGYIYLFPLSVLFLGLFHIYSTALNRHKKYKLMAGSKISLSVGSSGGQLLFGAFGFGFSGLILGKFIGDFLSFLSSGIFLAKEKLYGRKDDEDPPPPLKELATRYQEFPKVTAVHTLSNAVSSNFPVLILASFFSTSLVGLFTLSMRVAFIPVSLISASTYQVFSQAVTDKYHKGEPIRQMCLNTIRKLALIGIVPFGVLFFIAPQLFGFVFGESWTEAGVFTQILTPFLFMVFINSSLSYLPILVKRQRKALAIDLTYTLLRVLALSIGVYYEDIYLAVILYSAVGVLVQTYSLSWFLKLSKYKI